MDETMFNDITLLIFVLYTFEQDVSLFNSAKAIPYYALNLATQILQSHSLGANQINTPGLLCASKAVPNTFIYMSYLNEHPVLQFR